VAQPLILTLKMDERSQERFDRLRERHFPPERNYLNAHLTLFHKLPGAQEAEITAELREVCREQDPLTNAAPGRSVVVLRLAARVLLISYRLQPFGAAAGRVGYVYGHVDHVGF
jgi:hypothetical protein